MLKNIDFLSIIRFVFSSAIGQGSTLIVSIICVNYFQPEEYSNIELFFSLSQFAFLIISLGITKSITRRFFETDQGTIESYIGTICVFGVFLYLIFQAAICMTYNRLEEILGLPKKLILITPIAFITLFGISVLQELYTCQQKSKKYLKFQFFFGTFKFVSLGIVFYKGVLSAYLKSLYENVFSLIIILLFFATTKIKFNQKQLKENISYALKLTAPLVIYQIGALLFNFADQWIIQLNLNKELLAIYSFSYRLAFILIIFYNALSNYFSIEFYKEIKSSNGETLKEVSLILIISVVAAILIIFSNWILILLTDWSDEDVLIGGRILKTIVLSYYYYVLFLMYSRILYFRKKTLMLGLISSITCFVNIVLNILIVNKYSIVGVSVVTLISSLIPYLIVMYLNSINPTYSLDKKVVRYHGIFGVLMSVILLYDYF